MNSVVKAVDTIWGFLPENMLLRSLAETVALFALMLLLGSLVAFANWAISCALSLIVGSTPTFIIMNFLTYPGTVHHELSHALLVFLTGGRIREICLVPSPSALGHVEFETRGNLFFRSLQLSLSAVAPVLCGIVTEVLLFVKLYPNLTELWQYILFYYLAASIFIHMTLSLQDILNYFHGLLPSMAVFFFVFLGINIFIL